MKYNRIHLFAPIAVLSAAFGLVATDAGAAYSGTITRQLCPSGSIQTNRNESLYWAGSVSGCAVSPSGIPSGVYSHAYISPPIENTAARTTTVTINVRGTDHANGSRVCVDTYAYDNNGNFSASDGTDCTMGSTPTNKTITHSLTVPWGGALLTDAWSQTGGIIKSYAVSYLAGGT